MTNFNVTPASKFGMSASLFLWENILPAGAMGLMIGAPGSNKSTLCVELMALLAKGELEGDFRGTPVRSIYLCREDIPEKTIIPRLYAAGLDTDELMDRVLLMSSGASLTLPRDHEALMNIIRTHDAGLVVLDPLVAFVDEKYSTQGHYQKTVLALTPLAEAAKAVDCSILGVTHTIKNARGDASLDHAIGSRGVGSTARVALAVGANKGHHVVGVIKSNVGPDFIGWRFTTVVSDIMQDKTLGKPIRAPYVVWGRPAMEDEIRAAWESGGDPTAQQRVLALLAALADSPKGELAAVDLQEALADAFGVGKSTIYDQVIGTAISKGYVQREMRGNRGKRRSYLRITDFGLGLLEVRQEEDGDIPRLGHDLEEIEGEDE